jgi:ribose 5-phosphate isomerase A
MVKQAKPKQAVAQAALNYIKPGMRIGVGTGSTVNCFINELVAKKQQIEAIVSSSQTTTHRLNEVGLTTTEMNHAGKIDLYIDGADETNEARQLIKGGGGALTGEKIIAANTDQFVVIVDETKMVKNLGSFPLPIEVIPMARSYVSREMVKMGGLPQYREGIKTDYGNEIIDIYNLDLTNATAIESTINQIPGVVTNGIFAHRKADTVLVSTKKHGIQTF